MVLCSRLEHAFYNPGPVSPVSPVLEHLCIEHTFVEHNRTFCNEFAMALTIQYDTLWTTKEYDMHKRIVLIILTLAMALASCRNLDDNAIRWTKAQCGQNTAMVRCDQQLP